MDNREGWRKRVRDIRADGATWWWWWWWWLQVLVVWPRLGPTSSDYHCYNYFTACMFFTLVLTICPSQESEKQQLTLGPSDSSGYSCRLQQSSIVSIDLRSLYQFFTPTLVDGLSVKSEWEQLFLSPQDSSQYSGGS